jgi:cobalt-precorrin 5A hydrolase
MGEGLGVGAILGVGCRAGTSFKELNTLVEDALADSGLSWSNIALIATVDRRLEEPGLIALARRAGVQLAGYPAEQLAAVEAWPAVCEPAALLASGGGTIIVRKRRSANATVAIAKR